MYYLESAGLLIPLIEITEKIALLGLIYSKSFEAFGRGQMSYPLHVQLKKIQLVMAGENGEIEYGGTQKIKTNQINHLKILFLIS